MANSQDLQKLEEQAQYLRKSIHRTLREVRNAGTIGTTRINPADLKQEMEDLENRFLEWRENAMTCVRVSLNSDDNRSTIQEQLNQKAKTIVFYFTQYSNLVQIRLFLGKDYSVDPSWRKRFSFPITLEALYELSGSAHAIHVGRAGSPIVFEEDPNQHDRDLSSVVHLQLSDFHIQTIRLLTVANDVAAESYFRLSHFLIVAWLLEVLNSLDENKTIEIPSSLIERFGAFGDLEKSLKIKKDISKDFLMRESLIEHIPDIPLFFAGDEWIQEFVSLILSKNDRPPYFKKYQELFQSSEPIDVKEALALIIRMHPLPIRLLTPQALSGLLRKWYAQARMAVVQSMMPKAKEFSDDTRKAIVQLFMHRHNDYEKSLPEEILLEWAKRSHGSSMESGGDFEKRRKKQVPMFIDKAKRIKAADALRENQIQVDLVTLDLALENDFLRMGVEELTKTRKAYLAGQKNMKHAFDAYLSMANYAKSSLEKALVSKKSSFSKEADLRYRQKKEKEYAELLKLGEWFFGYPKRTEVSEPLMLVDLPLNEFQKATYREISKLKILGEYNILMHHLKGESPLYERLSPLDPKNEDDIQKADQWMKDCLQKTANDIERELQRYLKAERLEDIQMILTKSALFHTFMLQYPTLLPYHEEYRKKINAPLASDANWDEIYHHLTYPGFTFLLVHWFIKFVPGFNTHPILRAVDQALSPYIGYFLVTSFSMVGVNAYLHYGRVERKDEEIELLNSYLELSSGDDSFVDPLTIKKSEEERDVAWLQWKLERAFEIGFLTLPFLARPMKRFLALVRDRYYARLFEKLGFSPERFSWQEDEIRSVAEASIRRVKKDLNGSVRDRTINEIRSAEEKLISIIQKGEKRFEKRASHFKEEFDALVIDVGSWDPVVIIRAMEQQRVLCREGFMTQESLDRGVRAAQALLKEVRQRFQFWESNSPTAWLERRLIFTQDLTSLQPGHPPVARKMVLDSSETYFNFPQDPVLVKRVHTCVDPQGRGIELVDYERISSYVPRKIWSLYDVLLSPIRMGQLGKRSIEEEFKAWSRWLFPHTQGAQSK